MNDFDKYLDSATNFNENLNGLVYLASPFTHSDPKVQAERVAKMIEITSQLTDTHGENLAFFSPVLYSNTIAHKCNPAAGWYIHMLIFLEKCDALFVIQQEGWEESKGVQAEIAFALGYKMPITYIKPDNIRMKKK